MTRARSLSLLLAAIVASGCYTTTVVSGRPPAPATIAYDERWHHGVVLGLGEVNGMYDLSTVCPDGWAEIVTETTFANVMAELFSGSVYTPQTVTVRCASPAPHLAPPPTAPALPPPLPAAPSPMPTVPAPASSF